jgi:hypothetical protein
MPNVIILSVIMLNIVAPFLSSGTLNVKIEVKVLKCSTS